MLRAPCSPAVLSGKRTSPERACGFCIHDFDACPHPLETRSGGEELLRSDADMCEELRRLGVIGLSWGSCSVGVPGPRDALRAAAEDAAADADWKGLATAADWAVLPLQTQDSRLAFFSSF